MHRRFSVFAAAACLAAIAVSSATLADTSPEDAKDYRQAVMSSLGGHVSAISLHVRGRVEDEEALRNHAEALALTAAGIDKVFPEGTNVGDSEALPAVWDEPEAFAEAAARAKEATASFAEAARAGDADALRSAFRDVGASCRGCHDRFRQKRAR